MRIKIPFIPAVAFIALISILVGTVVVLGSLAIKGKSVDFYSIEPPKPKDETADWETYRNEEYGFEIKYPLNFKITTDVTPADIFYVYLGYKDIPYVGDISVHIYKNYKNETMVQYFTRKKAGDISAYNSGCQTCGASDIDAEFDDCMINKAYRMEIAGKEAFACSQMPPRINQTSPIYVFYNNYIYEFKGFNNQDSPNYDEYNRILSTFRFID